MAIKKNNQLVKQLVSYWVSIDAPRTDDFKAFVSFLESVFSIHSSVSEIEDLVLFHSTTQTKKSFTHSLHQKQKEKVESFVKKKSFYTNFSESHFDKIDFSTADSLLESVDTATKLPEINTCELLEQESIDVREKILQVKQSVVEQHIQQIENIHVQRVLNELDIREQRFESMIKRAQAAEKSFQDLQQKKLQLQNTIFSLTDKKVQVQYELAEQQINLKQLKQIISTFAQKKQELESQIDAKIQQLDSKLQLLQQQDSSIYGLIHKAQNAPSKKEAISYYMRIKEKYEQMPRERQLGVRDDIMSVFNRINSL